MESDNKIIKKVMNAGGITFVLLFILLLPTSSTAQVPISFGQTVNSSISVVGEQDSYSFNAIAGDVIHIEMTTTSSLDPYIRLYGPDGSLLQSNYGSSGKAGFTYSSPVAPNGGSYVVKAGDIDNSQSTAMEVTVECVSGEISFWYSVSSENNWDYLRFYIDDVQQDSWSGSVSWTQAVYSVTAGTHTFKWVYSKDGSVSSGQDTAWVDDIIFSSTTNPGDDFETGDLGLLPWITSGDGTWSVTNFFSGTYTIWVEDYNSEETGDYGIFVQRMNNPGNVTPIAFGGTVSASIDAVGEVDSYTFDAVAGNVIYVGMTTTSSLDPYVCLYGPDGSLLNDSYVYSGPGTAEFDSIALEVSGTYTMTAGDSSYNTPGETGEYSIFVQVLNDLENAVPIGFGETISASIDAVGEVDSYTFDAVAGDLIYVEMTTTSSLDPYVCLYGPDGSLLNDSYVYSGPGTAEFDAIALAVSGTYTVLAYDNVFDETGGYSIFVQRMNNPGNITPIAFGETVSASIDTVGEVDSYTFEAVAGDVVLVSMTTTSSLDPYVCLYGPYGSLLNDSYVSSGPGTAEFDSIALTVNGTYTVLAYDNVFDETGGYSIYVQRMNDPGNVTSIAFGETISASIDAVGEMDIYGFDAIAGDVIHIEMTTTSSLAPYVRLYGPDGTFLQSNYGSSGTAGFTYSSPISNGGSYVAKAGEIDNSQSTAMEVTVECVSGEISFWYSVSSEHYWDYLRFYIDDVLKGSWSGSVEGSRASYSVAAGTHTFKWVYSKDTIVSAGQDTAWVDDIIFPSATNPGEDFETGDLSLLPWITSGDGTWGVTDFSFTDTYSGAYTIWVEDYNGEETGNYGIFVQRMNNPGNVTPISFGETISASIDAAGEVDNYTFDAVAGDLIYIGMTTTSSLDPCVCLYGPDGSLLNDSYISSGPGTAEFDSIALEVSGTYTMTAGDSSYNTPGETGEYSIFVQVLNDLENAVPIGFGETVSASIDAVGEVDSYTFDAVAGDVVRVSMTTTSSLDPYVSLYGTDGSLLGYDYIYYSGGPGTAEFSSDALPSSGAYTILVYDSNGYDSVFDETGGYSIFVQRMNNSGNVTPISFGETISASIDTVGEVDSYTFDAVAGDVIYVEMTTTSSLDPYVCLYGPDGTILNSVYDSSGPGTAEFSSDALSSSGTYTVLAYDNIFDETGEYSIFVQVLNNSENAVPIGFGETISASIDAVGEVDSYTFEANAGDVVRVSMTTTSSLAPYVRLYRPNGTLLITCYVYSGPGTAEFDSAALTVSGVYTILAGDYYNESIGEYSIFIQRLNNPGDAVPISFGETISTSIDAVGEVDIYDFDANAGDVIHVEMTTTSSLAPSIELYGPDGSLLNSSYIYNGPGTAEFTYSSPISIGGSYVAKAGDIDNGQSVAMEVTVECVSGEISFWYSVSSEHYWDYLRFYIDDILKGSWSGSVEGSRASYSVAAGTHTFKWVYSKDNSVSAGEDTAWVDDIIFPSTTSPGEDFETGDLSLLPWITSGDGTWGVTNFSFTDTYSGVYNLLAYDYYGDETGEYSIFVQRMNNPGNVTPISFGETISASIDAVGEVDSYTFDAVADDVIYVEMTTTSSLAPYIRLYNPDGSLLNSSFIYSGPGDAKFDNAVLPFSGTYTIIARDYGADGTGEYTISNNLIMGDTVSLTISPAEGLDVSGFIGGPFNPSSTTYTLVNQCDVPIEWSVTKTQEWLDISKDSGTVDAGESDTVIVSINSSANTLGIGTYTDNIIFYNITENNRQILRSVNLNVNVLEGMLEVTPSEAFTASGPLGGPFESSKTYTLKNVGVSSIDWEAYGKYWLTLSSESGSLEPEETVDVTVSINENANDLRQGSHTGTITFTNITNNQGNTTREVDLLIDVSPSVISCNLSIDSIILGGPINISGEIVPEPGGGVVIDIVITPPDGPVENVSVVANSQGQFFYDLECEDIYQEGTWTISTSWVGNTEYEGADSSSYSFNVARAQSRVTVDVGTRAIKLGDLVDISGKFTPDPYCGADLSGREISISIYGPDGRVDTETTTTNDPFGHFMLQDYDGFNALGQWSVHADFMGDEAYNESTSDIITVQVVETAGYAVIVEGQIENKEGLSSHNKTANFVYKQLLQRGLQPEDILYFNNDDTQTGVYGKPSEAAVEEAITVWAREKMNARPANLYIILVDHGIKEKFYIHPDEITSEDLGRWLDVLQAGLEDQAVEQEIIALLGFCRSGSFIDDLSGENRIIITSASADEPSYKGPLDPNDIPPIRDGEFFITEFFRAAAVGGDVLTCFEEAVEKTKIFTSMGTGEPNGPYPDDARQHPLLEDNGDGEGDNSPSEVIGQDGYISKDLFIGVSTVTGNAPEDVQVTEVSDTQYLEPGEDNASFWARVDDNSRMRSLWLEVKSPGYDPDTEGTEQIEMVLPAHMYTTYNTEEDRYEWDAVSEFVIPGAYQVFFFARDDETGNVSSLKQSIVYKAKEYNQAPEDFDLLLPLDGEEIETSLMIMWSETMDLDGDPVTYTVEISKDMAFSTIAHMSERLNQGLYFVDHDAGLEDLTAYYWRVIAIDQFGAQTISSEVYSFNTNNTNGVPGYLTGNVFNALGQGIGGAVIKSSLTSDEIETTDSGFYYWPLDSGIHTINIEASGYEFQSLDGVEVRAGNEISLNFIMTSDINQPPIANAGPDQTVDEGVIITLDGSNSYDSDDGISSYQWFQIIGPSITLSDPTAITPTFNAPDVDLDGESLTFELTVTDNGGLQATDTCIVNVTWVNIPPIADAGSDQTVDEGDTVTLDGSNSYDSDDGISFYIWTQLHGTEVELSDPYAAQPIFTASDVDPNGESLTFELTVTDNGGLQATDTCIVNITWVNIPPIADAGSDQTVNEGDTVTLDGSNSYDSDDGIATYEWTQTAGTSVTLSDPTSSKPTFTSPDVGTGGESVAFQLTVTDNGGLQRTDTCLVEVLETEQNHLITLNSSWNLVSLEKQPTNTLIDNVLEAIYGKYISVWAYVNGSWQVYDPENPGFSDLTTLEAGRGYWINMSESATLTVSGSTPSNSVEISSGWNLIGYSSDTSQSVADALASIEGQYISVWAYIDGAWKVYDPENPGFSDLLTMEPGYGYWINASESCTWILP